MKKKNIINIIFVLLVAACTNKNSEQKCIDSITGSDTVKFNLPFYALDKMIFYFSKCIDYKEYSITNSRNEILYQYSSKRDCKECEDIRFYIPVSKIRDSVIVVEKTKNFIIPLNYNNLHQEYMAKSVKKNIQEYNIFKIQLF